MTNTPNWKKKFGNKSDMLREKKQFILNNYQDNLESAEKFAQFILEIKEKFYSPKIELSAVTLYLWGLLFRDGYLVGEKEIWLKAQEIAKNQSKAKNKFLKEKEMELTG